MVRYHDLEWGVPLHDDRKLFELLTLEGAQAGLSWDTILKRREGYRRAFEGFDIARIAAYDDAQVQRLLQDSGIIRNRAKVRATIGNARAFLEVQREFGSFAKYLEAKRPFDAQLADIRKRFKHVGNFAVYYFLYVVGEQVPPQRDEVALPFLLEDFANQTQALQPFQCLEISERDGDDDGGGGLEESPDELKLDRGVERHVEQDERALARPCHGRRGGCHQRGAIDRRRGRELFVEPLEERGQVRSAERQRGQRRRGDPREPQLVQRARQRPREARRSRHRKKVVERTVARGLEGRARGDGFRRQVCGRSRPLGRQDRSRQTRGKLREAEAVQPNRRAALDRNRPRQIVGRFARRADDQDFLTRVRVGSHERARFRQAQLGRGGFDGATVGEGDGEAPSRTPCRGAGIGRATRPTNSQLQTANSELRTHNSQLTTSNFKLQTANSKLNARRAGAPPTL